MAMSQSKGGPPSFPPNSDCSIASAKLLRPFLSSVPTWVSLKAQSWNVLPADLASLTRHAAEVAAPTVVTRNSRLVGILASMVSVVSIFRRVSRHSATVPVCRAAGVAARPSAYRVTPSHGPTGGVADKLDEAKAAFRAAWERPLSPEKANEKCSL